MQNQRPFWGEGWGLFWLREHYLLNFNNFRRSSKNVACHIFWLQGFWLLVFLKKIPWIFFTENLRTPTPVWPKEKKYKNIQCLCKKMFHVHYQSFQPYNFKDCNNGSALKQVFFFNNFNTVIIRGRSFFMWNDHIFNFQWKFALFEEKNDHLLYTIKTPKGQRRVFWRCQGSKPLLLGQMEPIFRAFFFIKGLRNSCFRTILTNIFII